MAMDVETCLSYIGGFINGEYSSTNATLKRAINDLCESSKVPSVPAWNFKVDGKSADRYDNYIRAFRYYWKVRNGSKGFDYNNKYIKAMLAVESNMGTNDGLYEHNAKTDVMQCLYKGDVAVYCLAKISPSDSSIPYNATECTNYGMSSDGYTPVRKIFSGHTPDSTKADPLTSICFGIYWLGYKTAVKGSIQSGVKAYNGRQSYLDDVLACADNPKAWMKNERGCTIS